MLKDLGRLIVYEFNLKVSKYREVGQTFMRAMAEAEKNAEQGGKPLGKATPGDGIRSMKTSGVFRALNFELYAKPNKTVMGIGIAGIVIAIGYLGYINYAYYDQNRWYYATNEDDTRTARPKVSRWDS